MAQSNPDFARKPLATVQGKITLNTQGYRRKTYDQLEKGSIQKSYSLFSTDEGIAPEVQKAFAVINMPAYFAYNDSQGDFADDVAIVEEYFLTEMVKRTIVDNFEY